MFQSRLEEEEFSTANDAALCRAIAAENAVEAHFLGSLSALLFLLLLGEWQNFELVDWHLLGAGFPIYHLYKAFKSRDKAFEMYQKHINER
jgi:hypothetical protein